MFYLLPNQVAIANYVSEVLIAHIKAKHKAVLGLATGSTMEPIYAELCERLTSQQVDVSGLTTFNLDEYLGLAPDHSQSYHYYMQQHLFNRLAFAKHRTFLPDGLCHDQEAHCQRYSELIREAGGIDVQLLGVGKNGHIGFNEPGTPFDSRTHVVALSQQTRADNSRFFEQLEQVPTHAITLGMQDIMEAGQILLVITGANKAETAAALYHSEVDEQMPASVVKRHPNALILLDPEAASWLPQEVQATMTANTPPSPGAFIAA